jgi:ArsR family transcriptional regulator
MAIEADPAELNMLRAVADPLRWRILLALSREQLCVCHLVEDLGATQSLVSHHLRVLRETGLVAAERHRYWTYYRLRQDALGALGQRLAELAGDAPVARRVCPPGAAADGE